MNDPEQLREKYPKILGEGTGYRGHGCEIACGNGWYDILNQLCFELQNISDRTGEQITATQIKEKFGGLRFYADGANAEHETAITEAENKAEKTCEVCGSPGRLRTEKRSWIKTLCNEHDT